MRAQGFGKLILQLVAMVVGGLLFGVLATQGREYDAQPLPWVQPAAQVAGAVTGFLLLTVLLRAGDGK